MRGRLARSAELGTEAVDFASRHGWSGLHHTIGAHLALGWAHFHWDELTLAEEHFEHAGMAARAAGDRSGRAVAALLSANVLAVEGPAGATKGLRHLRAALGELNGTPVPAYLQGKFQAAVPNLLAERGDVDEAMAMLEAETASFVELESLRAKLALAAGDAEAGPRGDEARESNSSARSRAIPQGSSSGCSTVWRAASSVSERSPARRSSTRWSSRPPTTIDAYS